MVAKCKSFHADSEPTAAQSRAAQVVALSSQICEITEVAAAAIGADLDTLDTVPIELGEMYEGMANVFLALAQKVKEKHRPACSKL